jgi:hypothetical protein
LDESLIGKRALIRYQDTAGGLPTFGAVCVGLLGWLWRSGYGSLSQVCGPICSVVIQGQLNLQLIELSAPVERFARAKLDGPWGWLLTDVEAIGQEEAA